MKELRSKFLTDSVFCIYNWWYVYFSLFHENYTTTKKSNYPSKDLSLWYPFVIHLNLLACNLFTSSSGWQMPFPRCSWGTRWYNGSHWFPGHLGSPWTGWTSSYSLVPFPKDWWNQFFLGPRNHNLYFSICFLECCLQIIQRKDELDWCWKNMPEIWVWCASYINSGKRFNSTFLIFDWFNLL